MSECSRLAKHSGSVLLTNTGFIDPINTRSSPRREQGVAHSLTVEALSQLWGEKSVSIRISYFLRHKTKDSGGRAALKRGLALLNPPNNSPPRTARSIRPASGYRLQSKPDLEPTNKKTMYLNRIDVTEHVC